MKKLRNNIIYNVLYQLLIVIIPLITSPYLSRTLGSYSNGIYSYANTFAGYFVLFATLGITSYGCRLIANVRGDIDRLKKSFWSLYSIQFFSFVISMIIYITYITIVNSNFFSYETIFVLLLFAGMLDITWFFQGLEEFGGVILKNIFIKVISLILIFIFIKSSENLVEYTIIMTSSTLIGQLILWPKLFKKIGLSKFLLSDVKKHILPVLKLFIPCLATSILSSMDKVMLGKFNIINGLGFYDYAEKIINIPKALISSIGIAMLPHMSKLVSNGDIDECQNVLYKSIYFLSPIIYSITFGLAAISENFSIVYWGENFAACGEMINILSFAFMFSAFSSIFRTQYLIPNMLDKEYIISICIGAVFNFVSNLVIIPQFGVIGACYTTVFSEFIIFISQVIFIMRKIKVFRFFLDTIPYVLTSLCMYGIVYLIEKSLLSDYIRLFVSLICGICISLVGYFLILILSKNEGAKYSRQIIKEKLKNAKIFKKMFKRNKKK